MQVSQIRLQAGVALKQARSCQHQAELDSRDAQSVRAQVLVQHEREKEHVTELLQKLRSLEKEKQSLYGKFESASGKVSQIEAELEIQRKAQLTQLVRLHICQ